MKMIWDKRNTAGSDSRGKLPLMLRCRAGRAAAAAYVGACGLLAPQAAWAADNGTALEQVRKFLNGAATILGGGLTIWGIWTFIMAIRQHQGPEIVQGLGTAAAGIGILATKGIIGQFIVWE